VRQQQSDGLARFALGEREIDQVIAAAKSSGVGHSWPSVGTPQCLLRGDGPPGL